MSGSNTTYEMNIEGSVIENLGLKQYDTVSAVVAELIANAYDADAETVSIKLPINKYLATKSGGELEDKGYEIIIEDNGHGMNPNEANSKFLSVGRKKREHEGETSREKDRPVMGRKGIGKLAPFGMCKTVEIISAGGEQNEDGYEVSHFILNYEDIKDLGPKEPYKPKRGKKDGTKKKESGTKVILRDFNHKKVPNKEQFSNKLSYRFADGLTDFKITIEDNKSERTLPKFNLSDVETPIQEGTKIKTENYPIEGDNQRYIAKGYMALAKKSYENEFQGVRIYVRGKLAAKTRDFKISSGFYNENTIRSYLIGEIHCDWLDEDEDYIQSNRQDILWDSELGRHLKLWGQERVKQVGQRAREPRRKSTKQKFFDKSGFEEKVEERFDNKSLIESTKEFGGKLAEITQEDELDDQDFLDRFTEMIIQLAPHNHLVKTFQKIKKEMEDGDLDITELSEMIETTSVAETHSMAQIAQEKVQAIKTLEALIENDIQDESKFQEMVENATWLLDPEWVPITKERNISNCRKEFENWYENKYDEKISTSSTSVDRKIPDFTLLSINNCIVVVEIKPPGHTFADSDFERFQNYITALEEFKEQNERMMEARFPNGIKFFIVCDDMNLSTTETAAMQTYLEKKGLEKPLTWREVLQKSKNRYQDFLDATK